MAHLFGLSRLRTRFHSAFVSVDALRGFDMFWIIGGALVVQALAKASGNPILAWLSTQMNHVEWEGFHFIDLIFPLFLFLIGVAIPYSLGKRLARGDNARMIYGHILLRVVVLVGLGMMVNGSLLSYKPAEFELSYSVLQMLALGYLVAAVLFLNLRLTGQIVATLLMWSATGRLGIRLGAGPPNGPGCPGCNVGDWVTNWVVGTWRGRQVGWIVGILGHASTAMLGVFAGQLLRSGLLGHSQGGVDDRVGNRARWVPACSGWLGCDGGPRVPNLARNGPNGLCGVRSSRTVDEFVCTVRWRIELALVGYVLSGD